jgi:hypothetical protein
MQLLKVPVAVICVMTLFANAALPAFMPCCCQYPVSSERQDDFACTHCVQVSTCGCPIGKPSVKVVPTAHCDCKQSLPQIIQTVDNHKRLVPKAIQVAMLPLPYAYANDAVRLSEKSSEAVPLYGPRLLALLCVWLN